MGDIKHVVKSQDFTPEQLAQLFDRADIFTKAMKDPSQMARL